MIKVKLEKWEKALVFQVLEMDENLRGSGVFFENEEFRLNSNFYTLLNTNDVGICGTIISNDNIVASRGFDSNEERDIYYNKVVELFKDYNKSLNVDKKAKIYSLVNDGKEMLRCEFKFLECNKLSMEIIKQDESLRALNVDNPINIKSLNGFSIRSENSPSLYSDSIYVRGYNISCDNDIDIYSFLNPIERENYFKEVIEVFKAYNIENTTKQGIVIIGTDDV